MKHVEHGHQNGKVEDIRPKETPAKNNSTADLNTSAANGPKTEQDPTNWSRFGNPAVKKDSV